MARRRRKRPIPEPKHRKTPEPKLSKKPEPKRSKKPEPKRSKKPERRDTGRWLKRLAVVGGLAGGLGLILSKPAVRARIMAAMEQAGSARDLFYVLKREVGARFGYGVDDEEIRALADVIAREYDAPDLHQIREVEKYPIIGTMGIYLDPGTGKPWIRKGHDLMLHRKTLKKIDRRKKFVLRRPVAEFNDRASLSKARRLTLTAHRKAQMEYFDI
jgi:hypothetical protein